MALFRKLECRALVLDGNRTSIALEPSFWLAADQQAGAEGKGWQEWARERLRVGAGSRASSLRVAILKAAQN